MGMHPYVDILPVEEFFFADSSTSLATSDMIHDRRLFTKALSVFFFLLRVAGLAMTAMTASIGGSLATSGLAMTAMTAFVGGPLATSGLAMTAMTAFVGGPLATFRRLLRRSLVGDLAMVEVNAEEALDCGLRTVFQCMVGDCIVVS
jgi:hypothetical protein